MRKLTFIFTLLLLVAASCTKADIKPNDVEDNGFEMFTRGSSSDVETPGQSESDEDNITDPNNDEDESDESSEGDLEALNSKN